MLIHGKGETTEDATFLNSLDVRYSQARHTMRYYYALPRCAAKSPVAYMSELCVHEWCPQVYVHVRISTCPPALPPISSPFEAALTLTLFQLPRKSRLCEISTPRRRDLHCSVWGCIIWSSLILTVRRDKIYSDLLQYSVKWMIRCKL